MKTLREVIEQTIVLKENILSDQKLLDKTELAVTTITQALLNGQRIFFGGNGGSAADAQHLASELSGRFCLERSALNAEAIGINIPFLTAVSNDYHFNDAYARYLEGAARAGDVLVLLSTSGNSENILRAAQTAREKGVTTIALTGITGGKLAPLVNQAICIPSADTPRIQEISMLLGHFICQKIEYNIFGNK